MQARLFYNKLIKTRNTVDNLLKKIIISYKTLELAMGFLLFVIKIVVLDRVFFRRLFKVISRPIIIIRIIVVMRADFL